MKVKVEFITARLNGKLLFVEAINSEYDEVQVIIEDSSEIEESSIEMIEKKCSHICMYDGGFSITAYEAKDICGTYGNLKVWIESKEIDFE